MNLFGLELAVLSACDTGLGEVAGGEGVYGLQRAFHTAGAQNVIASLWKVNDQATAALMKLFYYNLWVRKKPPIEALRQAQLGIYRHPDRIPILANTRGPKSLAKTVSLLSNDSTKPRLPVSNTRALWAGFVISGAGR